MDGTQSGDDKSDDPGQTEKPGRTVSVLTINILHGFPDAFPLFADIDARHTLIADAINELQPDVVALQEVSQNVGVRNRADFLSELTGYDSVWAKANGVPLVIEEGPAVMTRWPIAWSEDTFLPLAGIDARKVLGVGVETPHGELALYSAHLTNNKDEDIRLDQAAAAYVFATRADSPRDATLPWFFAGDTNSVPTSAATRFLTGEISHVIRDVETDEDGFETVVSEQTVKANLVDAWPAARPKEDGFTSFNDDLTRLTDRIDYIFMGDGKAGQGSVESCEIVLDKPVDGLLPSDHVGVLCTFSLPD